MTIGMVEVPCLLMSANGMAGRAQRPKTTVEQGGEASKLKELTMHTHQKSFARSTFCLATHGRAKQLWH